MPRIVVFQAAVDEPPGDGPGPGQFGQRIAAEPARVGDFGLALRELFGKGGKRFFLGFAFPFLAFFSVTSYRLLRILKDCVSQSLNLKLGFQIGVQ